MDEPTTPGLVGSSEGLGRVRALVAEYDSLMSRWRDASTYSQEVANLHATFKAREREAGKVFEDGTIGALVDEIERLRIQVRQADERGDEAMRRAHAAEATLEWYADEARALAKHMAGGAHSEAVLASVTVLALDAGKRAEAAMRPNKD